MSQACDRCHSRKVRCDKADPCRRCSRSGLACEYTDRTKERFYRQDQIDALEAKIRRLKERNELLTADLGRLRTTNGRLRTTHNDMPLSNSSQTSIQSSDVISQFSIDAAGEQHGFSTASFLTKFVDANIGKETRTSVLQLEAVNPDTSQGQPACEADAEARQLPPATLAKRLIITYLNHDHICYPIFPPSSLLKILRGVYAEPNYYPSHYFESFIFDIVLAIATTHVHKSGWQVLPSAESHYSRAEISLSEVLKMGGLRSLQAVLLITQYRMSSSASNHSASMWQLIGIASRISLQLGLHRESAYPLKLDVDTQDNSFKEQYTSQETSRACFWSTVAMDRIVSNVLGRPLAIKMEDVDTELPANHDGDFMWSMLGELSESDLVEVIGRSSIFRSITKYRLLCGRILSTMHGAAALKCHPEDLREKREEILHELDLWKCDAEQMNLAEDAIAPSCFLSRTWFEMIYHNAVLMLYRPSPKLEIIGDGIALQHIYDAARQSIKLYAALHRSRRLNHSWLTLQALFLSGLSYIFAVGSHFRESGRSRRAASCCLRTNPTTIEVVNDTRTCANVLVAVSESWTSLRHCTEVFNRLSDAVLADVIKFEVGSRSTQDVAPTRRTTPALVEVTSAPQESIAPTWDQSFQPPVLIEELSPSSVLAVDTEFQNTFDDLQLLYSQNQVDYPIYQFSQAWFDSFDLMTPGMGMSIQPSNA